MEVSPVIWLGGSNTTGYFSLGFVGTRMLFRNHKVASAVAMTPEGRPVPGLSDRPLVERDISALAVAWRGRGNQNEFGVCEAATLWLPGVLCKDTSPGGQSHPLPQELGTVVQTTASPVENSPVATPSSR